MMGSFSQADRRGGNSVAVTPRYIVDAVGPFDLDPCYGTPRPWPTAARMLDETDNGLRADWGDPKSVRVWCNPPYDRAEDWTRRMAEHQNGCLLVFARTDTAWFHDYVFPFASGILFLRGRLSFFASDGTPIKTKKGVAATAGAPSCLISYDLPHKTPKLNLHKIWLASYGDGPLLGRLLPLASKQIGNLR